MKNSAGAKPTRPYLRRAERQTLLLETATSIVENAGWNALTMRALADRGGTSRQLIYLHFPNLEVLLHKTAWHIFNEVITRTQEAIATELDNLSQAIIITEQIAYDLPPGRADALWALIAGTTTGTAELESLRQEIREHILRVWVPRVQAKIQIEEKQARALTWSLVMSFLGIRQMVRDGEINREQGLQTIQTLVEKLAA